jgi:hypothetical protein
MTYFVKKTLVIWFGISEIPHLYLTRIVPPVWDEPEYYRNQNSGWLREDTKLNILGVMTWNNFIQKYTKNTSHNYLNHMNNSNKQFYILCSTIFKHTYIHNIHAFKQSFKHNITYYTMCGFVWFIFKLSMPSVHPSCCYYISMCSSLQQNRLPFSLFQ